MTADESSTIRGSTYKAGVIVEGVKVRALLDHGAQVSLVRKELLPVIRERNGWTLEECHDRNCKLEGQPTGAGGYELGAIAVVRLQITTMDGEKQHQVPCYVLESSKPIWNGELKNCAMLLGTNVLSDLGFCIISSDRSKVLPEEVAEPNEQCDKSIQDKPSVEKSSDTGENTDKCKSSHIRLVVEKEFHVGPQQTRVKVVGEQKTDPGFVGVATPREGILAEKMCDFMEELWIEEPVTTVTLRNWGNCLMVIVADTQIGTVEEASLVTQDDPSLE